jgi:hypothetical protein
VHVVEMDDEELHDPDDVLEEANAARSKKLELEKFTNELKTVSEKR